MTLDERDKVMDSIIDALSNRGTNALESYSLVELIDAIHLTVAMEFRECHGRPEEFKEVLKLYSGAPWRLGRLSDRTSLIDRKTLKVKPEFEHVETPDSFADFCVNIGDGPGFWKAVYTRLGMSWHDGLPYFDHPPEPPKPSFFERLFKRR